LEIINILYQHSRQQCSCVGKQIISIHVFNTDSWIRLKYAHDNVCIMYIEFLIRKLIVLSTTKLTK